jgi:hypothetical protein
MPRTSTYTPLTAYLTAIPTATRQTVLTLDALERLLGRPLPASAVHVSFWTARANTGVGRALRGAGFRATLLVTHSGLAVAFTRVDGAGHPPVRARTSGRGRGTPARGIPVPAS